jgi:hypothetical protein
MAMQPAIDEARLNAFVGRMLGDLGALTNFHGGLFRYRKRPVL